ncbi:MAG: phenylalanyl-tRNA synthetase beta chain [Gaiellaceae bacterium]|jgi:phenylalanyl-tRNA synthetase beta chain|nr:phenylalanyl-tRNA synthetase beta chain [Gaiellaceae bacterium]
MKVPMSWLREYADPPVTNEEIAARLSVSSVEVETLTRRGVADDGGNLGLFRVGKVLTAEKHPNADRLQLTTVDIGEAEPSQIVCGAWNFGVGATVAVAMPGSTLPNGLTLGRRELRGQVSEGMILAEDEIDLGTDHAGIMLLPDELPAGTPLGDVLPLVEYILDVQPTGNRPDLLSVYGLAREVAAVFDVELAPWPGVDPERAGNEQIVVDIEDPDGCPRYLARLFRDLSIGPSPLWLRARINAAGMRPISNVVDVTNYVMLALGSPLHAFDADTLAGGAVGVRRARDGEEIRTLDGELRSLDARDLVIKDGERAIALAAIMGGEETEVKETTTSVLLEAANFEPVGILHTSERLGLRTEGSNRWEKGVDPYLAEHAARLATHLIVETSGARWVGETDVFAAPPERAVVTLRPDRTSALLGYEVPEERQHAILRRLDFEVDGTEVTVPTWRARDVTREIDVIEEVARFVLDEVPFTLPSRREAIGRLPRLLQLRREVEDVLVGCGLSEAYTPTLVADDPDPGATRLVNPLSSDQSVVRTTLLPSLLAAAERNREVGNDGVALFEIARVYLPTGEELPNEGWRVAGVLAGEFADAKGVLDTLFAALHVELAVERGEHQLLHPGKTGRLAQGWLGEVHPAVGRGWAAFELDLAALETAVPERVLYRDVLSFPSVLQDLAFVVDEDVPAADLLAAIRSAGGDLLRNVSVFDEYRGPQVGEGKRSLAFRVAFGSPARTLTDEDVAPVRTAIADAVGEQFGAVLRA